MQSWQISALPSARLPSLGSSPASVGGNHVSGCKNSRRRHAWGSGRASAPRHRRTEAVGGATGQDVRCPLLVTSIHGERDWYSFPHTPPPPSLLVRGAPPITPHPPPSFPASLHRLRASDSSGLVRLLGDGPVAVALVVRWSACRGRSTRLDAARWDSPLTHVFTVKSPDEGLSGSERSAAVFSLCKNNLIPL